MDISTNINFIKKIKLLLFWEKNIFLHNNYNKIKEGSI